MDASVYSSQFGWGVSESKGLAFPQTDLTQFQFKTDAVNPGILATWFDGMVVYNTPCIKLIYHNLLELTFQFYNHHTQAIL